MQNATTEGGGGIDITPQDVYDPQETKTFKRMIKHKGSFISTALF